MVEPSNAEQADWPDATRAYVRDLTLHFDNCERLAERLMVMAAKRSTETSFGWTHPDCETLQAAASTLRGAPEHQTDPMPIGVLSGIEPLGAEFERVWDENRVGISKGTTDKPMTLSDALAAFLGPMHAEYGRLIDEWANDAPVQIILGRDKGKDTGGYIFQTTMGAIQDLDRAYQKAFEDKCARDAKKARGSLL